MVRTRSYQMAINTCPSRSLNVSCISARCSRCGADAPPGGDPWLFLCVVCSAYRTYQWRRNSAASETGYYVSRRPRAPLRIHTQTVFSPLRSTEANYSGGKWLRMDRHRQRAMLRDVDSRRRFRRVLYGKHDCCLARSGGAGCLGRIEAVRWIPLAPPCHDRVHP